MTLPALIACDVDGTLINDDERITPRTRDAVCAAVEAGTQFVLATGRPPRWIPQVIDELGFAPMAVCANGAVIYDPATDQVLSAQTLSVDALAELAEIATRVIPGVGLAVERVGRTPRKHGDPTVRQLTGLRARLAQPGQHRSVDRRPAQRARRETAHPQGRGGSADMAAELAKHVGIEGDITYSTNNGLIEIVPIGVDKARASPKSRGP